VSKVDKSGRTVCIAFAQFSSTWFATRCLKMVQARARGLPVTPTWRCTYLPRRIDSAIRRTGRHLFWLRRATVQAPLAACRDHC
jgi:hypothetical protein